MALRALVFGPQLAIAVTEELAAHPNMARAVYAAEAAIGIAIASCSTPGNPKCQGGDSNP